MSEQESVWYYTQHGERKGPVSLDLLKNAISSGKLQGDKDLVWGPGLNDWVKIATVPELQGGEAPPAPVDTAAVPAAPPSQKTAEDAKPSPAGSIEKKTDPHKGPEAQADEYSLEEEMAGRKKEYGGMGRLGYFFLPSIFAFVVLFVGSFLAGMIPDYATPIITGSMIIALVLMVYFTLSRIRNLGMTGLSILWLIVPVMNIWMQYRLYICPQGYADHKKLDGAGKALLVIYFLPLFLFIAAFIYIGMTSG